MEKTFEEMYTELQNETGDFDATKLVSFKQWINRGLTLLQGWLKIMYHEEDRTLSSVAGQKRYQKPEDAIRVVSAQYYDGARNIPLERVADDDRWRRLNLTLTTGVPRFWHPIGEDLYELYPTPSASQPGGIILTIKVRQKPMFAPNYSTGTVSINNAQQGIVGVGTTFTAQMVGRKLRFQDGVGDGIWYRISGFTDATHITIENFYGGTSVSGGAFTIGDIPNLPPEMHQNLVDFGMWRYYLGKGNISVSREWRALLPQEMLQLDAADLMDDAEEQVFGPQPEVDLMSGLLQVPQNIT